MNRLEIALVAALAVQVAIIVWVMLYDRRMWQRKAARAEQDPLGLGPLRGPESDVVIIDDPYKPHKTDTPEARAAIIEWYKKAFPEDEAGQGPWHDSDLAGHVLKPMPTHAAEAERIAGHAEFLDRAQAERGEV